MTRSIFIPGITLLTTLLCTLPDRPRQAAVVPGNRSRRTERRYGRNRNGFTGKRLFCFPQPGQTPLTEKQGEVGYNIAPWLRDLGTGRIQHTVGGFYRLGDKQALSAVSGC